MCLQRCVKNDLKSKTIFVLTHNNKKSDKTNYLFIILVSELTIRLTKRSGNFSIL